ncbi:hypothetical protein BJY52DRAFT_1230480 [Lactarius psammicola]|nr:hypothetical protein BJY52DRAFT_1230480 [Lactarius psammicola]
MCQWTRNIKTKLPSWQPKLLQIVGYSRNTPSKEEETKTSLSDTSPTPSGVRSIALQDTGSRYPRDHRDITQLSSISNTRVGLKLHGAPAEEGPEYRCNIPQSEVVHRDQWGAINGAENDSAPAPSEGSTKPTTTEDKAGDHPDAEEAQQLQGINEIGINTLAAQAENITI